MPNDPLPRTLLQDRLPDWWRPLGLDLDGSHLALRRQGIEALREQLSIDNVIDAVAYAHGDRQAGDRIIDIVRATARSADGAFAGDVTDPEPPSLVAAALADHLAVQPSHELSTLISLLATSAAYGAHPPAIDGIGLTAYAARQLEHAAAATRRTSALVMRPTARKLTSDALEALTAVPQTGGGLTDTVVNAALTGHADILVKLASRIDELATRSAKEHTVLREQLTQHTWVLESWCETTNTAWSDVPPAARSLVAAVELAERTRAGGHPAIDAENLLGSVLTAANAGRGNKTVPMAGVAAAAPLIQRHLVAAPNAILFPIATALMSWREREGATGWRTTLKGVLPTGQRPELELSLQAYREALALRVLGHG